jgi:two-component system, OmpR family, response regulator RpaA
MRKVFTTGQVAKICKVAPRTVSKWFDSGRLVGYRIPGSQDRRIPREHLIRFLKEHQMPLGELEDEAYSKVLIIGADRGLVERLKGLMPEDDDFKLEVAHSGFEAGIQAESLHPDAIVLDLALGRSEGLQIVANLRRNNNYDACVIVGLAAEDESDPGSLKSEGFDDVFKKPFDPQLLTERIRSLIRQKKDRL